MNKTISTNLKGQPDEKQQKIVSNCFSTYLYLYDEEGKKYKTISNSIGEIVFVSGKAFYILRS